MERLLELTKRHKAIMDNKNIVIVVYTNASGFLWAMNKLDSGTDLGYSEYSGNCKYSGSFIEYEDAFEAAIELVEKCDLDQFVKEVDDKEFHWGNYARHLLDFHK